LPPPEWHSVSGAGRRTEEAQRDRPNKLKIEYKINKNLNKLKIKYFKE
jgi:hypothetical protein